MQDASSKNSKAGKPGTIEISPTLGDKALGWVKKIIPSAELRHELLPAYAGLLSWLPSSPTSSALEKILQFKDRSLPLRMSSPVILAAGGNKTGESLANFANLGFGGISVGSVTLDRREGNPHRPRVALLEADQAMQNAMGLNNPGVEQVTAKVDQSLAACHKHGMVLGISVAENPEITKREKRIEDLILTFRKAYKAADYIEINASCPNTGTNRVDEETSYLAELLQSISEIRKNLVPRKAVFLKLSPDMNTSTMENILSIVESNRLSGLVLFNTFPSSRSKYLRLKSSDENILVLGENGHKGGISGRPLYRNTLPAVQFIKKALPDLSIMACGGVDHGTKVMELLDAGADAVQCYTVLAYRHNAIRKIHREMLEEMRRRGISSLQEED